MRSPPGSSSGCPADGFQKRIFRGQKSDRRDAYGLAEKLRTGALDKKVFKAPQEFTLLRELSRAHITATRDRRSTHAAPGTSAQAA